MSIIQSGATTALWTIDPTSTAGRITAYDASGNCMADVSSLSNTLNALSSSVVFTLGGQSSMGIGIASTSGTITVTFEGSMDGTNWFNLNAYPVAGGNAVSTATANGQWVCSVASYYQVRVIVTSITVGASMVVNATISPSESSMVQQEVTQGAGSTLANAWTVQITDTSNGPANVEAKGTQGAAALMVQAFKDSGRVAFIADGYAVGSFPTETLISLVPVRIAASSITAGSSATSLTITAGKTLRLQSLALVVRNTASVQDSCMIRVRMNTGTVLTSSQHIFSTAVTVPDSTSGGTAAAFVDIPDGLEVSGTVQIGIGILAPSSSLTADVSLIGYEY